MRIVFGDETATAAKARRLRRLISEAGGTDEDVAGLVGVSKATLERVSALKAQSGEVEQVAAGLRKVAELAEERLEQLAEAESATKSEDLGEDDGRDAFGRQLDKTLSSRLGRRGASAEKSGRPDDERPRRDAFGRVLKRDKLFGT